MFDELHLLFSYQGGDLFGNVFFFGVHLQIGYMWGDFIPMAIWLLPAA